MHKHDFSKTFITKAGNPIKGFICFFIFIASLPCLLGITYIGIFSFLLATATSMNEFYQD